MNRDIFRKAIESPNPPHLLLSSSDGQSLYDLVKDELHRKWPMFELRTLLHNEYEYHKYSTYYEFSLQKLPKKHSESLWYVINEILSQESVKGSRYWIVLKDNGHLKHLHQTKLRVILEKNHGRATFLLLTNNDSQLIDSIKSRFLHLRIPHPKLSFQYNIYDKISKHIIDIITHDFIPLNKSTLKKIKDISHDILKYNLSIPTLLRELLDKCMRMDRWTSHIKYKIVAIIARYEYLIRNSFRSTIYLESLILELYYLSFAHYKINRHQEEGLHVLCDAAAPEQHDEE